jgi:DNA polymerase-3 subunit gamma/tau
VTCVAHVSLYRKYRPTSFAEVVGQDHVTTTLARAVDSGSWHHAYLFTGPRGTGKTSSARLLAMALNASSGPTSTPAPDDPIVTAIREGTCPDVIEIDAASNNGVDDVRDLRDRVAFAPAYARVKVYIVDECHMLSNAAWNAFLKTIEEPPDHVVFVFATTEPHKVLPTVLSRTQRFDLRRIPAAELAAHCRHIAELEGFTFEGDALASIVRAGDGSARDTLSVLDQVVAFTGPAITPQGVAEVLGSVPSTLLDRLAELLAASDVAGVLQLVQQVADGGTDLRQFATDAVDHLRSLLLLSAAPDAGLVDATPDRVAELAAQASRTGTADLLRAVELLNDAQPRMRRGNTQLPLEIALAKAALPASGGDAGALAARMDRLEAGLADRTPPTAPPPPTQPATPDPGPVAAARPHPEPMPDPEPVAADPEPAPPPAAEPAPPPAAEPEPPPEDEADAAPAPSAPDGSAALAEVTGAWEAVLATLGRQSKRVQAIVGQGTPVAIADDALVLRFPFDFHAQQAEEEVTAGAIAATVESVVGRRYRIRAVVGEGAPDPPQVVVDDEASAVINHEAALAAGDVVDDDQAHDQAIRVLAEGLGATVVEDSR